jgi:hypothetical protein
LGVGSGALAGDECAAETTRLVLATGGLLLLTTLVLALPGSNSSCGAGD